ncbi:hypothetical protein [Shouchella shacheensis]|nr:hypothetical protein [Shouchella shacheensis]
MLSPFYMVGLLPAISSWWMPKRLILLLIGLLGNGFVLVLLAMGISEP